MTGIAPGTMQRPWLAFLKHRRWWISHVNPPGPNGVRVTEDNAKRRVTEDGIPLRVTEGAF